MLGMKTVIFVTNLYLLTLYGKNGIVAETTWRRQHDICGL